MNRYPQVLCVAVAITLSGGIETTRAQNAKNAQRLSERWCAACHAIGPVPGKLKTAPSFASIANKENVTSDMIASFLLLPHATMPNYPLSRKDAQDLAAFIMEMKK